MTATRKQQNVNGCRESDSRFYIASGKRESPSTTKRQNGKSSGSSFTAGIEPEAALPCGCCGCVEAPPP